MPAAPSAEYARAMSKRYPSGFTNAAADQIWQDHLGNNAFVRHRDQCPTCLATYQIRRPGSTTPPWCPEGERTFAEMIDDVYTRIEEALKNQN